MNIHVSHIALLLVKEIVSQEKYGFFFTGVIILPLYNELKSSFDISINIRMWARIVNLATLLLQH